MRRSLQKTLLARLDRDPDGRAIAFYDQTGPLVWRSFRQCVETASALASVLRERGLGPGDTCVLVLDSSAFEAHAILAVLLLGAVPVAVAPPWTHRTTPSLLRSLDHALGKTSARVALYEPALDGLRKQLVDKYPETTFLPAAKTLADRTVDAMPFTPGASDVATMQLTSGTTGLPKICVLSHENILTCLDGTFAAIGASTDDVLLNWTPLYHDLGLVNNFYMSLVHEIPLVMLDPPLFVRKPASWLRALHESHATITWSPNFGFALASERVRDEEIEGIRLDDVRGFWNAAERIHYATIMGFYHRFRAHGVRLEALKASYGCAEITAGATFGDPDSPLVVEHVETESLRSRGVAQLASPASTETTTVVSTGRARPGVEIAILGADEERLPDGTIGQIAIRTESRMLGYLGEAIVPSGYLLTGDLGYQRGEELFWTGRLEERITVRGRKFDPSDFEEILGRVMGLRKGCFVAFGVDDESTGTQRLVIVAEMQDDARRERAECEREARNRIFAEFGIANTEVVVVEKGRLDKTSSGKKRNALYRKLHLAGALR